MDDGHRVRNRNNRSTRAVYRRPPGFGLGEVAQEHPTGSEGYRLDDDVRPPLDRTGHRSERCVPTVHDHRVYRHAHRRRHPRYSCRKLSARRASEARRACHGIPDAPGVTASPRGEGRYGRRKVEPNVPRTRALLFVRKMVKLANKAISCG